VNTMAKTRPKRARTPFVPLTEIFDHPPFPVPMRSPVSPKNTNTIPTVNSAIYAFLVRALVLYLARNPGKNGSTMVWFLLRSTKQSLPLIDLVFCGMGKRVALRGSNIRLGLYKWGKSWIACCILILALQQPWRTINSSWPKLAVRTLPA
jgi:hypothetical protein